MKHKRITLLAVAMTTVLSLSAAPVAKAAELEGKTISFKSAGAVNIAYTYTDMSKTMYAKSAVNVRSLPSTGGTRLGSLSKNQEVAITGQCNETGWYRISYNGGEGFVSNKYLVDEPVAAAASTKTAQAQTGTKTNSSTYTGIPVVDAAIDAANAKYGPNIIIFEDGTIYSTETWQFLGYVDNRASFISNYTESVDGFNRAIAEQVWAYVNEERAAAGLNTLVWDENIYNFACTRAQQIVTDFSHNGHGSYGENIETHFLGTAEAIHNAWYNSPGHHSNYMNASYGSGACAVYVYNGATYAVENFALASSPQTDPYAGQQTREYNGETLDLSGQQAEAFDNGNFWVASNGVIIYIQSNGNLSCNAVGDEAMAALNEYDATH